MSLLKLCNVPDNVLDLLTGSAKICEEEGTIEECCLVTYSTKFIIVMIM